MLTEIHLLREQVLFQMYLLLNNSSVIIPLKSCCNCSSVSPNRKQPIVQSLCREQLQLKYKIAILEKKYPISVKKKKKKKKSKVQRGIRATIAAGLSEAPRVTSRAAPSSASRPAALRQTDRRRGRGRQSQTLAAEGVGRGGMDPDLTRGPFPATPPLPGAAGLGAASRRWGGSDR